MPEASRSLHGAGGGRSGAYGHGRGGDRGARDRRLGCRRSGRRLPRVMRLGDGHDRAARGRPWDLPRRRERRDSQPRLLRLGAGTRRATPAGGVASARHSVWHRARPLRSRDCLMRGSRAASRPCRSPRRLRTPAMAAARRAGPAPRAQRRRVSARPRLLPGDARARDDHERGRADLRAGRGAPEPWSAARAAGPRPGPRAPRCGRSAQRLRRLARRLAAGADGRARRSCDRARSPQLRRFLVGACRGRVRGYAFPHPRRPLGRSRDDR